MESRFQEEDTMESRVRQRAKGRDSWAQAIEETQESAYKAGDEEAHLEKVANLEGNPPKKSKQIFIYVNFSKTIKNSTNYDIREFVPYDDQTF